MATEKQDASGERLSLALGCFSVGLGLAELAAPGKIANLIGLRDNQSNLNFLRAYGARELAAGIGILAQPTQPAWLWGRVAGDVLDLASLGSALMSGRSDKAKLGLAAAAVAGVAALDVVCAQRLSNGLGRTVEKGPRRFTRTVLINREPGVVYSFWRDLNNLPSFMQHLESVEDLGQGKSRWRARAAGGKTVEWEAEITREETDKEISWRSLEGSPVPNSGTVQFSAGPAGKGTLVRVEVEYQMPGGAMVANLARLVNSEPGQQVADELRRLKQVLETGEIVKSDASIHEGMHPAQPAEPQFAAAAHA